MKFKLPGVLSIALIYLLNISTFAMGEPVANDGYDLSKKDSKNVYADKNVIAVQSERTSKVRINFNIAHEIVNEVNRARTNPKGYIEDLRNARKKMNGNMMSTPLGMMQTNEGVIAIDDAIRDMERVSGLNPVQFSEGLSEAANVQLTDLKDDVNLGHTGKDGSTVFTRINRFGSVEGGWGENINFGPTDAKWIVLSLIIDDGVSTRGHRKNILSNIFNQIGIAYGDSKSGVRVSVMVFATRFTKSGSKPIGSGTKTNASNEVCSKKSDGQQVKVAVGNSTGKGFTINLVSQQCQETVLSKEIPPTDLYEFQTYKGAVFRVREVGSNRLLGEIIVNPARPDIIVQTDHDDSNSRVTYLEP